MPYRKSLSRKLRREASLPERILWQRLRKGQLDGCKFRRQHPIGPYFVDFVCLAKRLIVELDGGQHGDQCEHDWERTKRLEERGFKVIRFWNSEVLRETEAVVAAILEAVSE